MSPGGAAIRVGARTRIAAVLGFPVEHSRSPALHNAAYAAAGLDAIYVAFAVAPGQLGAALASVRALGLLGANLTAPHKEAAVGLCDALDEAAARAGAVNTVVLDATGRLRGHLTDGAGFADALDEALPGRRFARALVLGAGGAARAVVDVLRGRAAETLVVARTPERAQALRSLGAAGVLPWTAASLAGAAPGVDLVVDATPAGLSEEGERTVPAPIPVAALPGHTAVCSLVYHRDPDLLAAARARGLLALDGAGMLLHQAARAFTLMTGRPAPLEAMRAALRPR